LFTLSFVFTFLLHKKSIKISVALLAMGHERFSYLPTKSTNALVTSPNFKQLYGESLKDARFILNKINSKHPNPCEKEKLHLYLFIGLEPWYKNSLDFASGGSFVLALPEENSIVIKNLFGNNVEKKEELEDMNTILTSIKKRFENCAKRLPDKRNLDHLELFSKHVILDMEDKMFIISNQLNSCEEQLKKGRQESRSS
jgi:hypothetical protein